ncbi:MAG: Maf family protein [Dehalococcoidia bacterium]
MRVVLASASPRRRELLAALISGFDVTPADIDEPLGTDAVADATGLAGEKARYVAAQRPGDMIVGADTVVFDEHALYGKPGSPDEGRVMLRALRGRDHSVVTAIAVAWDGHVGTDASVATVTLRQLSDEEVERYLESGVPLDKAGAYAIQHEALPVVEALDGCYCGVMGLPLWRLKRLLESGGARCGDPAAVYARCATCPDRPTPG